VSEGSALLARLRPHRVAIAVGAGVVAVSAAIPAATVLVAQGAVDEVLVADGGSVFLAAAALVALPIFEGGLLLARTSLTKRVSTAVAHRLRVQLFEHYLRLGPAADGTGLRLAALSDEADEVTYAVPALVGLVRNPLALVGLAATAAALAPVLIPVAALVLPVAALTTRWGGARVRNAARRWRQARAGLLSAAQDPLAHASIVQDHVAERSETARFAEASEEERRRRIGLEVSRVLPRVAIRLVAGAALGALIGVGGTAVQADTLSAGGLVGFVVALALAAKPAADLSEAWSLWQRAAGAHSRLTAELERPVVPTSPEVPLPLPGGPLDVMVSGATVQLGGRTVLHSVSVRANVGEITALTGPSGAGKSTLLGLVARRLDPTSGVVQVGGLDLRTVGLEALRRRIGVVRQEGGLLARTVRENLCLAGDVDDPRLVAALDQAEATFLASSGRGLDTRLEEGARALSGGERQRLCLARALVHDPAILLLDEPTNQVDDDTALALATALRRIAPGRVVLVATHDPVLIAAADRVVTLADGRVEEQGSPQTPVDG
jgi:ABC-type multidrug transport system fused ATPase/permease subunit